jgi:hypothetical protein
VEYSPGKLMEIRSVSFWLLVWANKQEDAIKPNAAVRKTTIVEDFIL